MHSLAQSEWKLLPRYQCRKAICTRLTLLTAVKFYFEGVRVLICFVVDELICLENKFVLI